MAPSVGTISVTWNKTVKHQDKKLSTRFAFYYLEKKNFHVLEQSKQNIEMGIVKKTMNREYRNGRFLFEVFLLRYHEELLSWTSYSITIRQGLFEYPTF